MGIRITGIDTPFCGVSWEYTDTEKRGIQELFYYLESKRILVNPIEMEFRAWCEQSAIEMKNTLLRMLSKYDFAKPTVQQLRLLIDECNLFLDRMASVQETGIIWKNQNGDWADSNFSSAMKQFRRAFRDAISALSSAYSLAFEKEIPEAY